MKGELQQQVPSFKKDFCTMQITQVSQSKKYLAKEQLRDIEILNVEETRSGIYRNDGKGNFSFQALPLMAASYRLLIVFISNT